MSDYKPRSVEALRDDYDALKDALDRALRHNDLASAGQIRPALEKATQALKWAQHRHKEYGE